MICFSCCLPFHHFLSICWRQFPVLFSVQVSIHCKCLKSHWNEVQKPTQWREGGNILPFLNQCLKSRFNCLCHYSLLLFLYWRLSCCWGLWNCGLVESFQSRTQWHKYFLNMHTSILSVFGLTWFILPVYLGALSEASIVKVEEDKGRVWAVLTEF